MTPLPAILAAAAGIGFGHAVMPDHWLPLAVAARTQRHPLRRVTRTAALAGTAHVVLSIALGAAVMLVGLQFRSAVQHHTDLAVGGILLLSALVMLVPRSVLHRHTHTHTAHDHGHGHGHLDHDHRRRTATALVIPFGVAASPDLTVLPVFLAAAAAGVAASIATLAVFSVVTVTTFVAFTVAATATGNRFRAGWIDRRANPITAGTLLVLGSLMIAGVV